VGRSLDDRNEPTGCPAPVADCRALRHHVGVTDLALRIVDYGDVPTWIAAVATVLALVAAGFAAWASWNVLKRETQRDADRDDAERRQQANLVAAWHGVVPHPVQRGAGLYRPVVRNGSELPIYQVGVEVVVEGSTGIVHMTEVLGPGQWFVTQSGHFNFADHPTEKLRLHASSPGFQVAVSFSDAAGIAWRRDENGQLEQIETAATARVDDEPDE
jgi:hypothetical protein